MNNESKRFIIAFCIMLAGLAVYGAASHILGAMQEKDKIHAYCVEKGFGTEDECRSLVSRGVHGKWEWKFSL